MKIVVVSPHPDDESLGAGGLIAKHKKAGDQVFWINITDVEENIIVKTGDNLIELLEHTPITVKIGDYL